MKCAMHWGSCAVVLMVVGSVVRVPAKTKSGTSHVEHEHSMGEHHGLSFFPRPLANI